MSFVKELADLLKVAPDLPVIHDVVLNNIDREYEESKAADRIMERL